MDNANAKPRLTWVDTAKGICILLVILYHTTEHIMDLSPAIRDMLRATRMPLYYTIAGLFVCIKDPMIFINKKINMLIIPFFFFLLLGNLVAYIKSRIEGTGFTYFSPLYYAITEDIKGDFINSPIWFLLSLFDIYIIFMAINKIASYCGRYETLAKISLALLAGFCGIRCNRTCVDLPLFIDSSLTATPFFIFGHLIMSKTGILKRNQKRIHTFVISALLIAITMCIAQGDIDYRINNIRASVFCTYVPGILGVSGMLLLAKSFENIPIITHIGRYSIVYLGTHYLFFKDLRVLFESYITPSDHMIMIDLLIFITTIAICMISCYVLRKTVPWFIAQKDCISLKF